MRIHRRFTKVIAALKSKRHWLLTFGWVAIFTSSGFAQVDLMKEDSLENVIVSSSKIISSYSSVPLSITKINIGNRQDFLTLISLQEQINEVPGLITFNSNNYAQDLRISIRGFGARSAFGIRGIKLIVDGIPETTPDGQGQLDNLSLQDISNIEVIRGPSSALYGNAAGGVISIKTEEVSTDTRVELAARVGSYGTKQYQFKAGFGNELVKGRFSVGHQSSDGFRKHNAFEQTNILSKLKFHLSENSNLKILGSYLSSPVGEDPGGVSLATVEESRIAARDRNILFDAGEEIEHWKVGISYENDISQHVNFKSYAFLSGRIFNGRLPFSNGGVIDLNRKYGGHGSLLQFHSTSKKTINTLAVGYDIALQSDERGRFVNINGIKGDLTLEQVESFENIGIYILDHFAVANWRINAGLRFDHNVLSIDDSFLSDGDDSGNITMSSINPSIGVSRLLGTSNTVFSNYSTSFETPTLNELSANPTGRGGFNSGLNPQKAKSIEIGWRNTMKLNALIEVVLFHIKTEDESTPYELSNFPGRTYYRNAGKTARTGMELSVGTKIFKHISVNGMYSYGRIKFNEFRINGIELDGNRIPGLPEHQGSISLKYETEEVHVRIQGNHYSSLFADSKNTISINPWSVFNFQLGTKIMINGVSITPSLSINNLLDSQYFDNIRVNAFGSRHYEAAPGRYVQLGVTILFY